MNEKGAMRKHLLKDMTFVEFAERLADDPVILLPLGSQEEQGPMAPMGDYMITEAVAAMMARAADAVAAPTLPFGYADYFRTVPGGIALKPATFCAVLEDTIENFLDHGINRLVIVNGHSGNNPLIDQTVRKVKRRQGILVPHIPLWRSIPEALWQELHPGRGTAALGHGGDPLTSVYLHLFPELMRPDLIELEERKGELLGLPTSGLAGVRFRDVDVGLAVDVTDRCGNGIAGGNPLDSSAEKGRRIVDHLVDFVAAFVRHFKTVDPRAAKTTTITTNRGG
ncbi:MAG: creatininase family protein [Kiloniellaceae bacterium]